MKLIVVEIISDVCSRLGYWWESKITTALHRNLSRLSVKSKDSLRLVSANVRFGGESWVLDAIALLDSLNMEYPLIA